MKGNPEERAVLLGEYIACTGATVRAAANRFGISKSTVHKDVTSRLRHLDPELFRRGADGAGTEQGGTAFAGRSSHRQKYAHPP